MDFTATYCSTRRSIEERGWCLTSRLAVLTEALMKLAAQHDHQAFLVTREECAETRMAISDSNRDLRDHRRDHGC